MSHWREDLDARIDRCPSCAAWRWDSTCNTCNTTDQHEVAEGAA